VTGFRCIFGWALLMLLPAVTWGGENGAASFSLLGSLLQMFAALAVVIGLILLSYYAANRWLRGAGSSLGPPKYIRILETRYITPKKSLMLVEVGGEYLLLASSGDQLNLIKHINMLEDIEVLEVSGEDRPGVAFRERLQEFLSKLPRSGARSDSCSPGREGSQ